MEHEGLGEAAVSKQSFEELFWANMGQCSVWLVDQLICSAKLQWWLEFAGSAYALLVKLAERRQ
jgi:hypothetical protein